MVQNRERLDANYDPVNGEIQVRISERLLPSLYRMWRSRSTAPLASFASELIEAEVALFRLAEIRDVAPYGSAAAGNVTSNVWRDKLTREDVRRILNLKHTLTYGELARRFRVSASTIRRAIIESEGRDA